MPGQGITSGYLPMGARDGGDRVARVLVEEGASSTMASPIPVIRSPAPWPLPTSSLCKGEHS